MPGINDTLQPDSEFLFGNAKIFYLSGIILSFLPFSFNDGPTLPFLPLFLSAFGKFTANKR